MGRSKEHLKSFMIFGGWLIPVLVPLLALQLALDTEAYKEWKDPRAYWSEKIKGNEAWLQDTRQTVADCTRQLGELKTEEARRIWSAQKRLEGKSADEAAIDYKLEVDAQTYACNGMKRMGEVTQRALTEARMKLREVSH